MNQKNETLLDVTGMNCGSCVRHVDHTLRDVEGVWRVGGAAARGKGDVEHDPGAAPVDSLLAALREAGYESRLAAAA